MMTDTTRRGFMIWPDDTVEEVLNEGDDSTMAKVPGIYVALIANGLPILGGDPDDHWSRVLDFSINEHGAVTAYMAGPGPGEYSVPREAVKPLTDWLETQDGD